MHLTGSHALCLTRVLTLAFPPIVFSQVEF